MKNKTLGLFLGLFLLVSLVSITPNVFGETDRNQSYDLSKVDDLHGYFSTDTSRLADWNDSFNKPYFVTGDQNGNYVSFSSSSISFTYYKNNCEIKIFQGAINENSLPNIGAISWVVKYAPEGNDNFTIVNFPTCNTTIDDKGNEFIIHSIFDNRQSASSDNLTAISGQLVNIMYDVKADSPLKTSISFANLDSDKTNDKWIATETSWDIPSTINLDNHKIATNSFEKEVDLNKTQAPSIIVYDSSIPLIYDMGIAKQYLNKTGIINNLDGTSQLFNDYILSSGSLQLGKIVTIDPQIGYNAGTQNYVAVTTASVGTSCGSPSSIVNTGTIFKADQVSNDVCKRVAYQYNVNALSGTIIDDVSLTLDTTSTFGINCDVKQINAKPSTLNAVNLWNFIGNGSSYLPNNSVCVSTATNKIIDLGALGVSDLQSKINSGNFTYSIGFKFNSELRDSQPHTINFANVKLGVIYHLSTPSQPLNPITITHAKNITINYNIPNYKGSSSITNYNLFKSIFPYAQSGLPDLQLTDAGGYTDAIDMSQNKVLLHMNGLTGTTTNDTSGNKFNFTYSIIPTITGGTITFSGGNEIHTFTSNGTFTTNIPLTANVLVVGGAGVGAGPDPTYINAGGGGAGGGYTYNTGFSIPVNSYSVTVGSINAQTCGNPIFTRHNSVFSSITVAGGGAGGTGHADCDFYNGYNGGSGGGGAGGTSVGHAFGNGGTATGVGTGHNGGNGVNYVNSVSEAGGGGGGSGSIGVTPTTTIGGAGGSGTSNSISGSALTYSQGGQGGTGTDGAGNSGTGNSGSTGGVVVISFPIPHATIVNGIFGNALYMEGFSNSYLTATPSSTLLSGVNSYTISIWDNFTSFTNPLNIITYPVSAGVAKLQVNGTYSTIQIDGIKYFACPLTRHTNSWNFDAFTYTGSNYTIYNNGTKLCSNIDSSGMGTPTNNTLVIGSNVGKNGQNFQGVLDEFSLTAKARSASEILSIEKRGTNTLQFVKQVGNITTITDTGLSNGATWYYKVGAKNTQGNGTLSSVIQGTSANVPNVPTVLPPYPNGTSTTVVILRWGAPSSNNGDPIFGYQIQQKLSTGSFAVLQNNTGTTTLNYNATGKSAGSQYTLRVGAWNGAGLSIMSNNVTGISLANVPTALIASSSTNSQITTNWGTPANGNSSLIDYKVERSKFNNPWVLVIAHTGNLTNSYHDAGLISDSKYTYRISTNNGGGTSAPSNNATFATGFNAPTGLVAKQIITVPLGLNVTWVAPVVNDLSIEGYQINRNGTILVNDTHSNNPYYVDSGLLAGRPETYKVAAWNSYTLGSYSSTITAISAEKTNVNSYINATVVGNVIGIEPRVFVNNGSPTPNATQLQLYNYSTLIKTQSINVQTPKGSMTYLPTLYNTFGSSSNYTIKVTLTNITGTVTATSNYSLNTPAFIPTNPVLNYTVKRNAGFDQLTVTVNRQPINFKIECNYKTGIFLSGTWHNYSDVGYYFRTDTVSAPSTVYITCYNDQFLFTSVSYGNYNGTTIVNSFLNGFGTFFGVPVIYLGIALFAALFTGRSSPTGIVMLTILIGVAMWMGLFTNSDGTIALEPTIFTAMIVLTAIGMLSAKKYF